jgi:ankyrin repeat protein
VEALIRAGADVNPPNQYMNYSPLHYLYKDWDAPRVAVLLLDAGANVNARDSGGEATLADFDSEFDRGGSIFAVSRRVAPILLRAGADMAHLDGPPFHNPYLQKIHDTPGGFKAYEKRHADALVATFVPKLRLPPEMIRHVVFYWAHVGFY